MEKNYAISAKGNYSEIVISGKLLQDGIADGLLTEVDTALENGALSYLLNLSQLSYTNSSGIALFIRILTKIRTKGGELIVLNPNETVSKLFTITKLDQVFNLVTSIEEAEDFFKK
jgi:anti-sigma B factor antagonist